MPMIQKPIRFDEDAVAKLEIIAEREAVDNLIESKEWQLRKVEEALASIKSGEVPVVSHEETKEFLKKLGVLL